jgi:hypothetical protein
VTKGGKRREEVSGREEEEKRQERGEREGKERCNRTGECARVTCNDSVVSAVDGFFSGVSGRWIL